MRSTLKSRLAPVAGLLAALGGGLAIAAGIGSSAGAATPATVTLGSTSGMPSANICGPGVDCTYVPYLGASNPELQVPFDGTVTSFSVVASSGPVSLRVLRPAPGGQFTGAGTSPPETITAPGTVNTYAVSMPVKAGDVLGLDNASSALMFDTSTATDITAYYNPALPDGHTGAPTNYETQSRLLLSATVQASSSTSTSTTTGPTPPPAITHASLSHRTWRESKTTGPHKTPVGTTFSFTLNEAAHVTLAFNQQLTGRRVKGKCVAQTKHNKSRPSCKRTVSAGQLSLAARAGTNHEAFNGRLSRHKTLAPGRYTLLVTATAASGRAKPVTLSFTIVS